MIVFLHICQIFSAIAVIALVLMQRGKGAEMGAAFGSGASGSLFGSTGSANFLTKSTAVLATLFFVSTLAIAYFARYDFDVKNPNVSSLEQALEQEKAIENKPAAVEQSTLPPATDSTQSSDVPATDAKPAAEQNTLPPATDNIQSSAAPVPATAAQPAAEQSTLPPTTTNSQSSDAPAAAGAVEPSTTPAAK